MAVPIVLVGPPVGTPSTNISAYIDFATLITEDTGNQADDTATFELLDIDLDVTDLAPNGRILVTQDGIDRFNGFISTLEPAWEGISRRFRVNCTGISGLLDKCIIPPSGSAYVRNNSESDKSRIQWLLNTFGDPFLDAGSSSFTYIQTLEPDMPRQNFANLTLRQAIERVLGAASESANYYIDTQGRLHTWDNDNEEAAVAPFEIVTTLTLAATEVAPSDLRVMWDTSDLVNYYFVRGKNSAGSGAYSDATSIAEYGRWQAFIDGPDSDNTKKAKRLGRAALKDTKNPIIRTSFTVETDYCENGDGEIWRPGQMVTITSPAHGMTGYEIRVIRVTTSYLNGLGERRMEVECGALRANFLGPDQWGTWGTKYPDPTLVIQPGPPVIDGPVPTGHIDDPVDPAAMPPLDDFERTVEAGDGIGSPPFAYATGDLVLLWRATVQPTGSYTGSRWITEPEMDGPVGDLTSSGRRFVFMESRTIDGTEPVDWTVTLDGSSPDAEAWIWHLIKGPVIDENFENQTTGTADASLGPGDKAVGYTDTNILVQRLAQWESTEDEGYVSEATKPAGSTMVGSVRVDGGGDHGEIWMAVAHGPTQATNPATFEDWTFDQPNGGSAVGWVFRVGAPYTGVGYDTPTPQTSGGWGSIPEQAAAPWEGDNVWDAAVSAGSASIYTDGSAGIIDITADATLVTMTLASDSPDDPSDEPWGPWAGGDAELLWRFKVDPLGDITDADANMIEIEIAALGEAGRRVRVHLGDNVAWAYMSPDQQRGIVISQGTSDYSDFVPKTLVADTEYYLRFDFRGTSLRAKLWAVSDVEPVDWDLDEAKIDEPTGVDIAEMDLRVYGNDGMLFTFENIDATVTYPGYNIAGTIDHEGSSGPFGVGEAFTAGTLRVWVDDIPVTTASEDAAAGTFVLMGPVYHDAGNHPAGCAVIRVQYEKA